MLLSLIRSMMVTTTNAVDADGRDEDDDACDRLGRAGHESPDGTRYCETNQNKPPATG